MKDVPVSFQTAFQRHRTREERRAELLTVLWAFGTFAAVIVPENYGVKAISIFVSWLVLMGLYYYCNPDANFHRAWLRATREVDGA